MLIRGRLTSEEREEIWNRDKRTCYLCGQQISGWQGEHMHVDHVEAFVRGGTNELDNLRAVHPECNLRKADRPSNWKTPIAQLPPQSAEKRQAVNSDIKQTGYSADEKRAVLVALDKANEKLV